MIDRAKKAIIELVIFVIDASYLHKLSWKYKTPSLIEKWGLDSGHMASVMIGR
jgi:hypothetical protein